MAHTTTAASPGLRSGNPALSDKFIDTQLSVSATRSMSVAGVSIKTLVLLAVLIGGGVWGWASAVQPRRAALFGLIYAICEGFCLGAISAMFDAQTEGIVGAAVLSTLCVFIVALLLYVTRIIKPSQKMAFAVVAGIGGLMLLYTFVFFVSIFNWAWLYSDNFRTIGIVVTLIAIVLAALSLVLDFGTIEIGVKSGAPKELEWYMGFGLMVTLIWLYISILKLLALLARNR